MNPRTLALLLSLISFQSPGISQSPVNNCDEKHDAPQKLFVFIGEFLHAKTVSARENYNEARYSATYRIIEKVCGHYPGDTICFNVIQPSYDSSFKKNKYQLLMLTKDTAINKDYVLWADLFFDVLPTANRQWAVTYTASNDAVYSNQKKLSPKKMKFSKHAFYDTRGMTREEIDITYPESFFKIKKDKVIPLWGNTINEVFQHQKEGTLAHADIYDLPPMPADSGDGPVVLPEVQLEEVIDSAPDSIDEAIENAYLVIKDSLSKNPFSETAIKLLLKNCRTRDNYDLCSEYFDHLIRDYPDSAQAYFLNAKFRHVRATLEDSSRISLLQLGLKIDSNRYDANYDLALSYYRLFREQPNPYHAYAARKWFIMCIAIDTAQIALLKYPVLQLSKYLNDTPTIDTYQKLRYNVKTNAQGIPVANKYNWYFPIEPFLRDSSKWINDCSIDITRKLNPVAFKLDWLSEELYWFNEPSLTIWQKRKIYRFLWLRSFHVPVVIQMEKIKRNVNISWKISRINDSLRTLEPPTEFRKNLTPRQWKKFEKSLTTIDFWSMISDDYLSNATDGAVWLLEASINGKYKVVKRSGYIYPKYTKCLRYLIDLTDLNLPENKIY